MALIIKASATITNPKPNTPKLLPRALTSDSFSGANTPNVVGRRTDSAYGGEPATWVGDNNVAAVQNETLVRGATLSSFFVGVPEPAYDYDVSFLLKTLPDSSGLIVDVRRIDPSGPSGSDAYRLNITNNGLLYLAKRVSGTTTTLISSDGLPRAEVGSRYGLRIDGTTLSITENDTILGSYTDPDPITQRSYTGFAGTEGTTFGIDDFVIRSLTALG